MGVSFKLFTTFPYRGPFRLSGGLVDKNEGLEIAARRELDKETGVTGCTLVQTGAYGRYKSTAEHIRQRYK